MRSLSLPALLGLLLAGSASAVLFVGSPAVAERGQADLRRQPIARPASSPTVESVSLVAPDVMAITIQAGRVVPGSLAAYRPVPGDTRREVKGDDGVVRQVLLVRGGQEVGWLIGPRRDRLVTYEALEGDPLREDGLTDAGTYGVRLAGTSDAAVHPTAVWRKSTPTDWAQPGRGFAMRHTLYLKLPRALVPGRTYAVDLVGLNTRQTRVAFAFDPARARSEAVHANQIGFRPDDPVKRAFLAVWLGTGGAQRYPDGLRFGLVEEGTGKRVFSGPVGPAWPAERPERMFRDENFSKTDVRALDFSAFRRPGRYRVVVEGIGCSYPFEIGPRVWERAFRVQMAGLYNQRSGVALGPPYTRFVKPRDFHPADGVKVTQSSYAVTEGKGEFEVARHDTGKPVPEAWGGYHDAGDWNPRRATHLRVTMAQLEMIDLFPAYFGRLRLSLPPRKGVPDVLTEALFELDLFRRLQMPDGGVRFGIETASDPIDGEVSWLQSMPAYVYAPDAMSSYVYAAAAGRAARLLERWDAGLARVYRESALRAMRWAESDRQRRAAGGAAGTLSWEVKDDRNLAALTLYQLTGDGHWHQVFMEDTCLKADKPNVFVWGEHVQRDAAFLYARLKSRPTDPTLRRRAVGAIEQQARQALAYAAGNAYHLTTPDKGKPMFLGFYSTPDAVELVRAHYLTGRSEYLAGAVQACQFQSGCNPNNLTYTVGLGANSVRHPLHLDSRRTGQPAPVGLTVYGNVDFVRWNGNWITWPMTYHLGRICKPSAWEWPLSEAYWDVFLFVAQNEFTVDVWAPNVYVWGYLAARGGR